MRHVTTNKLDKYYSIYQWKINKEVKNLIVYKKWEKSYIKVTAEHCHGTGYLSPFWSIINIHDDKVH